MVSRFQKLRSRNFTEDGVGVLLGPHGERWIVDLADFDRAGRYLWSDSGIGYARARISGRDVYLHRFLLPGAATVDHVDQNPRNCLRHNLRDGSNGINQLNSPKRPATRSRFRGVSAMRDRWQARITVRGQRHYLGTFLGEDEAAAAVRKFAQESGRAAFY
jgi:hypothetical protein